MGITPSNPIYNNIDNIKIFQFILFTYVSSISFISLIIILILQLKNQKKNNNTKLIKINYNIRNIELYTKNIKYI